MLSVQPQQYQQHNNIVPEQQQQQEQENFRTTEKDFLVSQHLNTPGLLSEVALPNNFEVANRAFYATINKFTRQSCPDASRRRSPPYSFLENWHLHSIYSKSQQTLLGITPVRPAVLLSGDDFMFTPPFIQQEEDDEEEEDILDWDQTDEQEYQQDEFYSLSSPLYRQQDALIFETNNNTPVVVDKYSHSYFDHHQNDYNSFGDQENIWLENDHHRRPHNLNGFDNHTIHIQQNDDLLQDIVIDLNQQEDDDEEEELYTTDSSSSDEQRYSEDEELSSFDLMNLYDTTFPLNEESSRQHNRKSSSSPFSKSQEDISTISSVISYQSLADIINMNNTIATTEEEDDEEHVQIVVEEPSLATESMIEEEAVTRYNNYGSATTSTSMIVERHTSPSSSIFDTFKVAMNLVQHAYYAEDHDDNNNDDVVEMGTQHNARTTNANIWTRTFIYIMYIWQLLILCAESFIGRIGRVIISPFTPRRTKEEREPLLI